MEEIGNHVPYYWLPPNAPSVEVDCYCKEFQAHRENMQEWGLDLVNLSRQQNLHRYGMFVIREQFLVLYFPTKTYFRVRRYVTVPFQLMDLALETHLDSRRCEYDFVFDSIIHKSPYTDDVIFIVCLITCDPYADILLPSKCTDYFIEYIAYIR